MVRLSVAELNCIERRRRAAVNRPATRRQSKQPINAVIAHNETRGLESFDAEFCVIPSSLLS